MDRTLKGLVGAACVAIVAAVGYYFWGEWELSRASAARDARIDAATAELFEFAKAEPNEFSKVRDWCASTERRSGVEFEETALIGELLRNCRALGYL